MVRMVQCVKLQREAEGLDFPPYPGELGKRIFEKVSREAWADWIKHQTMLVNENRLNLSDIKARKYLAEQMEAHFFGAGAEDPIGYVPPSE
ncbi:MAG: oxidative damage protection protein [Nitrosomonadaceae bacterium]|jgi:Fe-S cluster biosynthesis and repair protein YggX|nr:oxidative damage protection protein [Nitrosomonadaceae bacterium]